MSNPSDPEKYSIDEMMDRLKSRSTEDSIEDGELVTRADGTKAIRVRKRKRRTEQPHKEERRNQRRTRVFLVSATLIVLLLLTFAGGFAITFANSTPFRESLIKKISASTGAEVDLQQFRMNPSSANANGLVLKWPEGNALRELSLRGIKAKISPVSFLGKSMVGEEWVASEGTLNLRLPQAGQPLRNIGPAGAVPPVHFNQYTIPKFHLLAGDPAAPMIRMSNSEATFEPAAGGKPPQLLLNRGQVSITGWPNLLMDRARIAFGSDGTNGVKLRLEHEADDHGYIELNGTLSPYDAARASQFTVLLKSFPIAGLAGADIGRVFDGKMDTLVAPKSNYLTFTPGSSSSASLSATFKSSSPLELKGLPFLSGLSQTLDDDWFARPVFDSEITGVVRRTGGAIMLQDLNLVSKNRMAIRGTLDAASNRSWSGKLEIGIAEGMIKTSANKRLDAMFSPVREGFRWITLTLGGDGNAPTDNFKILYDSAAVPADPAPSGTIPSFEDLTRPK